MRWVFALPVVAALVTPALAQTIGLEPKGVPASGSAIALKYCAACHLVAPGQARANVDVPTFTSIAQRLPTDTDLLTAFIINPHPPMPNMSLTRQEIRDVLAYITTLK